MPALCHPSRLRLSAAALLCLVLPTGSALAMQRVTLRNGFTYDCTRQEPLDASHVRLYLLPATPQASGNYVDLPLDAVVATEILPDPTPLGPPAPAQSTPPPSAKAAAAADIHALLHHAGAAHNIDVELLASIVHAESGGRAQAVSRAGALGLMQLMPATALSLGVVDARLPAGNINGGTAYLDALLTRYGNNLALALAAYNAGPAAVDRYRGIPPFRETRAYVARVMTEFKRRKAALARQTAHTAEPSR